MDNSEILKDMRRTLRLFCANSSIVEIRILKTEKGIVSGYYSLDKESMKKLLMDIAPFVDRYSIYFTINPPKPELLSRSPNRLTTFAKKTTKDDEIDRLDWLHIDLDPVRAANTSATAEELAAAKAKALEVQKGLRERFEIINPVVSRSGNGYNLAYKLGGLENSKENRLVNKNVGKVLDDLYSDEKTKVDTTTYNPSRIIKIFGCKTFKGKDTEERPHRFSSIEEVPDEITVVPFDALKKLAGLATVKSNNKSNVINIEEVLKKNNVIVARKKEESDSTVYVLKDCPWNNEHTNQSAYIIQFRNGNVTAGCHHDSCQGKGVVDLPFKLGNKDSSNPESEETDSTTKICIAILNMYIRELFADQNGDAFAYIEYDGINSIFKIMSIAFEEAIQYILYTESSLVLGSTVKRSLQDHYKALAKYSKSIKQIEKRVHKIENTLFYDLCNDKGEVVKIISGGVEIVSDIPPLFIRSNAMLEQVAPVFDENINLFKLIKKHFRIKDKAEALLLAVYISTCFIQGIAHPILVIYGEKGAAKTTSMKMLRIIIDPVKNLVMALPSKRDDLIAAVSNSAVSCFDNIQKLTPEMSEILCIVCTGGAISKRQLYTDNEEKIIEIQRCLMLNGISVVLTQPDLLDRALLIELLRIRKTERKTEKEVMQGFNEDLPLILGSIFQTLSTALSLYGSVELKSRSRMADFEEWGFYIAEAMGKSGEAFLEAYRENQKIANEQTIVSNPLADLIVSFMMDKSEWEGTATELLRKLVSLADYERIEIRNTNFPKSASILSRRIKEIISNLEEVGISYDTVTVTGNKTKILLARK